MCDSTVQSSLPFRALALSLSRLSVSLTYSEYTTYTLPKLRTLSTLSSIFILLNTDWISGGGIGRSWGEGGGGRVTNDAVGSNRWRWNRIFFFFFSFLGLWSWGLVLFCFFFSLFSRVIFHVICFSLVTIRTARSSSSENVQFVSKICRGWPDVWKRMYFFGGRRKLRTKWIRYFRSFHYAIGGGVRQDCRHWKDHVLPVYLLS